MQLAQRSDLGPPSAHAILQFANPQTADWAKQRAQGGVTPNVSCIFGTMQSSLTPPNPRNPERQPFAPEAMASTLASACKAVLVDKRELKSA